MDSAIYWFYCLPAITFVILQLGELRLPFLQQQSYQPLDWLLNITGLFIQGVVIPLAGILLAYFLFPMFPFLKQGAIPLNFWGAFALNFVVIDFAYYWQHRWFHGNSTLWKLHVCHHSSPRVDIWATSRNNLWVNFLFVYLLLNPLLGFLCQNHEGFFAGAMVTASLDIIRHSNIDFQKLPGQSYFKKWGSIFVMPWMHHSHHNMLKIPHNFGANLIIWDKLFNTFNDELAPLFEYQPEKPSSYRQQFYYPFIR
jgi:sterol desaturase/sphingolipid hydroxylase (fatty acid hydroxylase superfamily)